MTIGWSQKKIGDVCRRTSNIKWASNKDKKFEYIDLSSVSRESHEIIETDKIEYSNAPSRAKKIVEEGDILFGTTRPTLKRVTVIPEKFHGQICSTGFCVLRPNFQKINSWYIYYFFQCEDFMKAMERTQRGTSYPAVTDKDIKEYCIPLPPLPEQKRIVAILDEAFEAIDIAKANIEKNIQNSEELFQSKLNEIFSQKSDGWEERKLTDVCEEILAGGDAPKENYSKFKTDEYFFPIYGNAVKKKGLYGFTNETRVNKPSITISARGSGTGHTEIRNEPFLPIVRLIVLTPHDKIMRLRFLKYSIDSLEILRSGTAIPQLTVPMIKKYSIPIPSLETQKNIEGFIKELKVEVDQIVKSNTNKLSLLNELKKSFLQKAFSGELTANESLVA